MRKIIILLFALFSASTTHAGLFEYYLGEQSKSNVKTSSQADVVEKINIEITPAYDTHDYYDYRYEKRSGGITKELYERYPVSNKSRSYIKSGYYVFGELERNLENESHKLDRELDDIEDEKEDIKDRVRDIKSYRTRYYRDLLDDYNDQLQYLQKREEYLEDLREDIKDELRDLRKNKSYSSRKHYYRGYSYDAYNYDRNYDYHYYYDRDYHNRDYDSYYYKDDYYYDDYYYHKGRKYRRKPIWVNPYLPEVKDGRIFVK